MPRKIIKRFKRTVVHRGRLSMCLLFLLLGNESMKKKKIYYIILVSLAVIALVGILSRREMKQSIKKVLMDSYKNNNDIYGWIRIPNTKINYPILQSAEEKEYYLNHTYKKEESIYGAIYSEKINEKNFNEPTTILYGHAMNDGSMFGDLSKFMNYDFFNKNDKVLIFFKNEQIAYRICAVYRADYEHLYYKYQLNTKENTKKYFEKIETLVNDRGGNSREMKYTGKPVLILSTCYQGNVKDRLVVICIQEARRKQ